MTDLATAIIAAGGFICVGLMCCGGMIGGAIHNISVQPLRERNEDQR